MLLGESGEPGYLSLRSESVPYPLSASIVLVDLGRSDFGGGRDKFSQAADVRRLTATEDSLDCAWLAVAAWVHRSMMAWPTAKSGTFASPYFSHSETKSGPNTGTRTYRI